MRISDWSSDVCSPDLQVARLDVAVGEPVTGQSLAQGLAQQLHAGERAVAVPVDEIIGAGNRVAPGDLVDIFFALEKDNEVKGSQVRLLQSRVRVLAYGTQSIDGPPVASDKPVVQRNVSPPPDKSALLAVPVERVNEMLLASRPGHLQLALLTTGRPTGRNRGCQHEVLLRVAAVI